MDEFKSNVPRLVNLSKIVDQPVNIAVALSRLRAGKFDNCGLFCLCYKTKQLMTAPLGNKTDLSLLSSC